MYFFPLLALGAGTLVNALAIDSHHQPQIALEESQPWVDQPYLIELSPGKLKWVSEEEKWELKRVRTPYSCITEMLTLRQSEWRELHGHH